MGMILAPIMLPEVALRSTGMAPDSPEFEQYCRDQLRKLIRHLAEDEHP